MSSLKRRYHNFKKTKINPYAGRGLDKFALVTAELQSKREKLAAELDTPLSMVKFAIGTHNRWAPIILSRSTKKESHPTKKKSGAVGIEGKLALNNRAHEGDLQKGVRTPAISRIRGLISENGANGKNVMMGVAQTGLSANTAHVVSNVNGQELHFQDENTDMLGGCIGGGTFCGDGLHREGFFHTTMALNQDSLHVDSLVLSTQGSSIGTDQEDSGKTIKKISATSEAAHMAIYEEARAAILLKNLIGAIRGILWVVSTASRIVSIVKWHTKSNTCERKILSSKRESLRDADEFCAAPMSVSLSSTSSVQVLPSPTVPWNIPSISITSEHDDIVEMMEDVGAPHLETVNKQHRKCKVKGLLKIRSAPSTPRDSRQPKKPFTAASTLSKTLGVNHRATDPKSKDEVQLLAPRTTNPQWVPLKHCSIKVTAAEARKESARRAGHALAAAGLVLSLSGLVMGYVSAIVGVVCWWYVLPSLRKAVGDRPMVKRHHHNLVDNKTTNAKAMIIEEVGGGKYYLFSEEHKKKVIMEGFLDRERRSNV